MRGRTFMVRFADDAVLAFEREDDARRVLAVLSKRLGKYGLTLHPEKTRLVDFRRPVRGSRPGAEHSFDMLGFTHFWGRSRRDTWVVKRKTAKSRFSRTLKRINRWCRANRHKSVVEQRKVLNQKLRGHDAYYGVTGNGGALRQLRRMVERIWRKWLNRRSHKTNMTWAKFKCLLRRYPLVPLRVVHSIYR